MKKPGTDKHFVELMRRTQEGDRAAYVRLLREATPIARGVVQRRRGSMSQPQDIEDIVQDVLLSLHAARATYDPTRPFLPWLMAIVHNRLADAARREIRRKDNEILVEKIPETFSAAEANIQGKEFGDADALRKAIRRLPKGQRDSIELLKLREMSLKEASVTSGKSISALKVAVHRGIKTLRRTLKKSEIS